MRYRLQQAWIIKLDEFYYVRRGQNRKHCPFTVGPLTGIYAADNKED